MAECVLMKSGGGADLDVVTAAAADVVAPKVIVGQDGEPVTGTMVDRGNWGSTELAAGASVTIPAGRHGGSGRVTAKSLAAQTGGATATDPYVKSGLTYWKDGVKRTGTMAVSSVVSFSVAAYSTSQVLCTWKNPAKGPYSGVLICAKAGGYPNNAWDGMTYQGVGSNSALNGISTVIMSGLSAGTTYYFRIWVYCTCSAETLYSGYLQATCRTTAHGRAAFTSSGTWTVPAGVRSINIHCTGGGGAGGRAYADRSKSNGGGGGGGGYTAYKNNISVSPGNVIAVNVGAGGVGFEASGSQSSALLGSAVLVAAAGGIGGTADGGGNGGSGGGRGGKMYLNSHGAAGASDGVGNYATGKSQGTTTKEFGNGTLYSGGGGGGGCSFSNSSVDYYLQPGAGGAGGGGAGAPYGGTSTVGTPGTAGTGGGGGGGSTRGSNQSLSGNGGSGNVIITW